MVQHILVGLDGSEFAEDVLPQVITLAQRLNASVTLLHVAPNPDALPPYADAPTDPDGHARGTTTVETYLAQVAQRLTRAGITARTALATGDTAAEIVRHAWNTGAGLIALATRGRSGISAWLYGSVADEVVRTSELPVLLLHQESSRPPTSPNIRRIIVPLDGSLLAEAVLFTVGQLASRLHVPAVLLRTVEPAPGLADDGLGLSAEEAGRLDEGRAAAQRYLLAVADDLRRKGATVSTAVAVGDPCRAIVDDTRRHPGSLVVMATRGESGLSGLIMGSTARRVVQRGGVPVILLRPIDHAAGATVRYETVTMPS